MPFDLLAFDDAGVGSRPLSREEPGDELSDGVTPAPSGDVGGLRGKSALLGNQSAGDAQRSDERHAARVAAGLDSGVIHEGGDGVVATQVPQISWVTRSGDLERSTVRGPR